MNGRGIVPGSLCLVIVVAGAWAGTAPAVSQDGCVVVPEPNDAPESVVGPVAVGAACLAGTLPAGDQDLGLWEVPPDETGGAWTITLDGLPGARTVMDVRPVISDPGVVPILPGAPVLELAIEPDGTGTRTWLDGLVAPGRYLIGVSAGGAPEAPAEALGYRVAFEPGAQRPSPADAEPNDEPATATPVADAFVVGGDLAGSWDHYRWTVGTDTAGQAASWTLEARVPLGASGDLTLAGADGAPLVRTSARQGLARLADLVLAPGDYLVRLEPPASAPTPYLLAASPSSVLEGDPEPNEDVAHATRLFGERPSTRGRLAREQDEDWYAFTVTQEMAAKTLDVRLIWRSDARRELCLEAAAGPSVVASAVCRESHDGVVLGGLSLPAGEHTLRITGDADPDDAYVLRVDPGGPIGADFEREPNDATDTASALDPRTGIRGRGRDGDVDHFRVRVTGEPQLWEVVAEGAGIDALDWEDTDGTRLGGGDVRTDASGASLTDLYLIPGEHWLRVAADGDYALRLAPLGPPDPAAEREPNDVPGREERLVTGQDRNGRLPLSADTDVYRFELPGDDHLVLGIDVDEGVSLRAQLADHVRLSQSFEVTHAAPLRYDAALEAGRYRLTLTPLTPSDGRYRVHLDRADPFVLAEDQEPDDDARSARPWPADGIVNGDAIGAFDTDWYALPDDVDPADVVLVAEGALTSLHLTDGVSEVPFASGGDGLFRASLPGAQGRLLVWVSPLGPYRLRLGDGPLDDQGPAPGLPLSTSVVLEQAVAAHWPTGQRIPAVLHVANAGPDDLTLAIDWAASDPTWLVEPPAGSLDLAAGTETDVRVEVRVPPMAPAGAPVGIAGRLATADGRTASTFTDVSPSRDAVPVTPELRWAIPDPLLGGLDAASQALGAFPIASLDPEGEERLHDGFAAADWGLSWPTGGAPVTLSVDLAGDEPVPVAGTILHPLSADPTLGEGVATFELALSMDGATWQTALTGSLAQVAREQAFALPAAVPARYAQLRVSSQPRATPSRIELGEWKVVAEPGWAPSAAALDLADPHAGGHIVTMTPLPGSHEEAQRLLDADLAPQVLAVEPGTTTSWVVGFMEDRAARVAAVEWYDPLPSDAGARLDNVAVWLSEESPLGPWRELGTWALERTADGFVAPFILSDAPFARFLRFEGRVGRKQATLELPGRLVVREAGQGDGYRSVLGQWGMGERSGPLEWQVGVPPLPADDEPDPPDSPDAPRTLDPGRPATGRVARGADEDWYLITVADDAHGLLATLRGIPRVGAALRIIDATGSPVPASFGPGPSPGSVTWSAAVEPGASYLVEVLQPPASLVAAFDTSASVVTELASIEAGLRGLAAGIREGEEGLRIVPFDGEPLLPGWPDDPWLITDAVQRYRLGPSSSRVEANLESASRDLATREGGRAILLVTDAASSAFERTDDLWAELAATRPLVVAVEVGGEGETPAIARHHLMVDWATSANGIYRHAATGTDIEQAFDALATWLRRPALYELTLATTPDAPPEPEPGSISVVGPEVGGVRRAVVRDDVAVGLVLDTSGSMLETFAGERRIDVARRVLRELVTSDLPAGMPVALRVFEPRPRSCRTLLATPLGPLDPGAMAATIDGLDALKGVPTPLAAAIEAVAGDLEAATGPRIVVVVSDGEESCKGDPETAVERLRARGVEVTLNVVGLALDRRSRRSVARLAALGGGVYLDARDPDSLGRALRAAVSAPFAVLDAAGAEVARGTIGGEPLALPPGTYRVTALSDPRWVFDDVFLGPGSDLVLELAPAADGGRGG